MNLKRTVAPAVEPIDLAAAAEHLGASADDWAAKIIDELIPGAREQVEADTGRALITQTWTLKLDAWPCGDAIELPIAPATAVTSITYKLSDGATVTTLPTTVYDVDLDNEPARVFLRYGQVWPSATLHPRSAITITFTAGYGASGASVPVRLKQAMLLMLSHRFENREAVTLGNTAVESKPLVLGYQDLIDRYVLDWKRLGS